MREKKRFSGVIYPFPFPEGRRNLISSIRKVPPIFFFLVLFLFFPINVGCGNRKIGTKRFIYMPTRKKHNLLFCLVRPILEYCAVNFNHQSYYFFCTQGCLLCTSRQVEYHIQGERWGSEIKEVETVSLLGILVSSFVLPERKASSLLHSVDSATKKNFYKVSYLAKMHLLLATSPLSEWRHFKPTMLESVSLLLRQTNERRHNKRFHLKELY